MTGAPTDYILEKLDQNRERIADTEHRIEKIEGRVGSLERFKESFSRYARRSIFITVPSGLAVLNIAPDETVSLAQKIIMAVLP